MKKLSVEQKEHQIKTATMSNERRLRRKRLIKWIRKHPEQYDIRLRQRLGLPIGIPSPNQGPATPTLPGYSPVNQDKPTKKIGFFQHLGNKLRWAFSGKNYKMVKK